MRRPTRRKNAARAIPLLAASLLATRARNYLRRAEHPSVARALTPEPKQTIRVFYNVYAPLRNATAATHAIAIVDEQFRQLRASPMWPFVKEVRYATIGPRSIIDAVAARCEKLGTECVHLGHARVGNEANALHPLHAFCRASPDAAVAYLHNKGSFSDTPENGRLRRVLLRGLASRPCAEAVTSTVERGPDACDVCSMRFSPVPHQHVSGNMWAARCEYIALLREPHDFRRRMNRHWNVSCEKSNASNALGADCGACRYAFEHWVHARSRVVLGAFTHESRSARRRDGEPPTSTPSTRRRHAQAHPAVRPCDVLDAPFHWGYGGGHLQPLPAPDFRIDFAPAPRYLRGHPRYRFATIRGAPTGMWSRRTLEPVLAEWRAIYGAAPPADSRLLLHYRSDTIPTADLPHCRPTCRSAATYPCVCLAAEASADVAEAKRLISLTDRPGVKDHLREYARQARDRRDSYRKQKKWSWPFV